MINRKLLATLLIITFAYQHSPLIGMDGIAAHPERRLRINNLRNQIDEERATISKQCWIISSCMAAAAGSLTGWFFLKDNSKLPQWLVRFHRYPRALIGATSATLLSLGGSWLTKHWGMNYFFTHRGTIKNLKHEYYNLKQNEKNDQEMLRNSIERCNFRIQNLNDNIRRLESDLRNNNGTYEMTQQQRALDQKRAELQQVLQTIDLLRGIQVQSADAHFQQHVNADPTLSGLSKQQLEEQLIHEIQTATQTNNWRNNWTHICQLIIALVETLHPADAKHPTEELSDNCKDAVLPLLKFTLENHVVDLCNNLSQCGLQLHMLHRMRPQQTETIRTLFRNVDTELIRQFVPTCPICMENIDNEVHQDCKNHRGVVLSCGYVICQSCINDLQQRAQFVHNEKMKLFAIGKLAPAEVPPAHPVCPECQIPIV